LYARYIDAWQFTHAPGCFTTTLALRETLVLQHVGVAALFSEIFGKGVALPDGLEALVLLAFGARDY
jgi:hypothetical protein